MCLKLIAATQKKKYNLSFFSSFNGVYNDVQGGQHFEKLKALFAAGDPFAAEKAIETWQKYESINTEGNCFRNILQKLP